MQCPKCGMNTDATICPICGESLMQAVKTKPVAISYSPVSANTVFEPTLQPTTYNVQPTPRHTGKQCNKWVAFLLCLFLGFFGGHKFYEGKVGIGILYLFTFGLFGVGWLVDCIILLCKSDPYYL